MTSTRPGSDPIDEQAGDGRASTAGSVLSAARLVCEKDLRMGGGWRMVGIHVVPFAAVVMVLFAFALGAEPLLLSRAGSGLLWVTALFSSMLMTQRTFSAESGAGISDAMRLSALIPAGTFAGKTAAMFVHMVGLSVVLHGLVAIWYQPGWRDLPLIIGAGLTANLAISAASCVYGLLSASSHMNDSLMGLLVLPALAPVLLSATQAYESAADRASGGWSWVALMGVFAVSYCVLGAAAYGPLTEDAP